MAMAPRSALVRLLPRPLAAYQGTLSTRRGLASGSASHGFRCSGCGQHYAKWQGQCSSCDSWGTVAAAKPTAPLYRQSNAASFNKTKRATSSHSVAWAGASDEFGASVTSVFRMKDVEMDMISERIELSDREMNWVLGGGLVAGSLTLLAGNPGVGKSTLALQIANMLAQTQTVASTPHARHVLYVSGEESVLQVKMRAERLGAISDELFVGSETNIDTIIQMIENRDKEHHEHSRAFDAVVIDSIQTIYAEDIPSPAGTVNQVKECTLRLLRLAKQRNIPVILIGHVTKSGDIAGPKVLEHIVDTVVQLEGDPQSARRFLRCQKNRFGNTSEVGVFNMTDEGLQPLVNPLLAFVSDATVDGEGEGVVTTTPGASLDGSSITIAMEGSRPIPLEIQALANRTHVSAEGTKGSGFSRVRGVGVSFDKLQLLFAVLEKRGMVSFYNRNVFVNVAEGYTIQEPAADLALAVALASSVLSRPVLPRAMFLGELALSGHLRPVKMLESRLVAAHKIGLEVCVIPKVHEPDTRRALRKFENKLTILEASTVLEALEIALQVVEIPTSASTSVEESAEDI
ncbi:hypothetical protein Poli38472_009685 [Pythium oligandrum]|uniref:RecA family profile 1 domain-containing protein n=1 Tax=Pythium oligandrum TaxID=41045 RepID=A0A8K1FJV3_PYTOL|nr:hypothetical protein Poli38472_009685 [Pythium oligandrum]|eukprot:TMW62192.1 hypothetical protein Poli38472_009685 [Pythium oligandrum]